MAPGDDDQDQALQKAIRESLSATTSTHLGDAPIRSVQGEAQSSPPRINIEDRIHEMSLRPALELPFICEFPGDTWIYIDPPPKQPEQDQFDYARYIRRYESPMLVKQQTLLRHCTPDKIVEFDLKKLFGPSAQFRTIRRRKLTDKFRESPHIKYVIDLTPPSEGDDAVYLTTELCCSEGVRLWYQASVIWSVSKILVGGDEEYSSKASIKSASSPKTHTEVHNGINFAIDGSPLPPEKVGAPMPLEYSPVRHRTAIERVIAALAGIDPRLDSAPKVWTTFAVAKYLGIKHSPVTDYIVRWLRAYPNSYFLEICPEVSLKIADGLEIHDLARDTFAILVGEEALDSLFYARVPESNRQRSVYGRRKEDLPEKVYSRIEYASKRFLERINNDFQGFAGRDMQWIDDLPEVRKLSSNAQPELQDTIQALRTLLKDYVRGTIYKFLCADHDYVPPPDFHRPGGCELIQRRSRSSIWTKLSVSERILSRTFWHSLLCFGIFEGSSNVDIKEGWSNCWKNNNLSPDEKRELKLGTYCIIQNSHLNHVIRQGNMIRVSGKQKQPYTTDLPDRTRDQSYAVAVGASGTSNKPYQSENGPDLAHSGFSEAYSEQSVQPSSGPEVHQVSPKSSLRNFQFEFAPTRAPHDRSEEVLPAWPLGAPRHLKGLGYVVSADDTPIFPHEGTAADKVVTESPRRQWPAPPSLTTSFSWSSDNLAREMAVGQAAPSQQRKQDERSSSPFFGQPEEDDDMFTRVEAKKQKMSPAPAMTEFFNLHEFFLQARAGIEAVARSKLQYADALMREEPHEIGIINTLVCLQDSEWKYLPLWAGGYDDGSGGVFNDQIPAADLGFSAPGPDVHTGITPANSIRTPSESSMVDSDDGAHTIKTVNTSMANNRSFQGDLHRQRVYAADSLDSMSSEEYDMFSTEDDSGGEEEEARKQTEAQERAEAAEDQAMGEAQRFQIGTTRIVDENYADLFDDDDGDETDRAFDGDSMMGNSDEDDDTVMV